MSPFLKARIRATLRALNIRVRPGGFPRRTMGQFTRHLARIGFTPGTIIDVGVADGTLELYAPFPKTPLLLVEPMGEFENAMQAIQRKRPKTIIARCAAGADTGHMTIASGGGHAAAHNARQGEGGQTVKVNRIDDLVKRHGLPGPYVIKVDVEGAELDVIAGATRILPQTDVVILETSLFRFPGRKHLLHEAIAYMADLGFVPYEIFDGITRPYDGAQALYDVAFVRANGPLKAHEGFDAARPNRWLEATNAARGLIRA